LRNAVALRPVERGRVAGAAVLLEEKLVDDCLAARQAADVSGENAVAAEDHRLSSELSFVTLGTSLHWGWTRAAGRDVDRHCRTDIAAPAAGLLNTLPL
jgi:hypothetical protein